MSHSSAAATQKWLDLLGGSWNVNVVIDEDRAVYAAWGLGLGSVWYVLNPTSTVAGFKEKGWLGSSVAGSLQRSGAVKPGGTASPRAKSISTGNGAGVVGSDVASDDGPATVMGNKWQVSANHHHLLIPTLSMPVASPLPQEVRRHRAMPGHE